MNADSQQQPDAESTEPTGPRGDAYRLLYDGQCPFCRAQAERLVRWTGNRVVKATLQAEWPDKPIPEEMKLVGPDGRVFGGAEAAARALSLRPVFKIVTWIYFVPLIRGLIDATYRWIVRNRYRLAAGACPDGTCQRHDHEFILTDTDRAPVLTVQRPTFRRSVKLFHVLLGLIHLAAFASLYVQIPVLIGSGGLLPAAETIEAVRASAGRAGRDAATMYADFPTLFWFDASDAALRWSCLIGVAGALCYAIGLFRRVTLVVLTALYISFVTIGQTFFSFQWDNLLIETSVCAMLLPAYSLRLRRRVAGDAFHLRLPGAIAVFVMHWLLFRVYFESGIAKLLPPNGGWRDLSAMSHYYNTAPLATWIGWYAHNLPQWWHRIETLGTLLIEIVVPVFIFAGRRFRLIAFVVFQGFQIAIAATANYGLFNYLTFALGFLLLEDRDLGVFARAWARMFRRSAERNEAAYSPGIVAGVLRAMVAGAVGFAIFAASLIEFALLCVHDPEYRGQAAQWRDDWYWGRLRLVNSYHLFAGMTTERLVPRIEGRNDRGEWFAYPYRYAPSDPTAKPRFAAPHHPRLDFQVWFTTLSRIGHRQAWFVRLLQRLCTEPGFAAMAFREDPLDGELPSGIRVMSVRYDMTTPAERDASGAWWRLGPADVLMPEVECASAAR